MADVNLGQIAATTLENYHDTMVDNIFKKHALLNHLKNNGGVKLYDGGRNIRVPVMYGVNSTVKTFTGVDTLDLTYQEGIDAAEYDYKFYDVSVVFTLTDSLLNSGKSQVIDLLKGKIKQAEMSLAERLNNDLYNGSAATEITGLDSIIDDTGTIGDIAGSTYTWWRSYVDDTAEALTFADMRVAKNTANNGNGGSKVSIITTTQALYEKMFSLLTTNYQMNPIVTKETKRLADASFSVLEFEGVPVSYDEQATAGSVYFINVDNFKLGIHKDANFKAIKKSEPTDQHIDVQHIVFAGNTVVDRRASLAKLVAKTI